MCQIIRVGRMDLRETYSRKLSTGLRRPFGISGESRVCWRTASSAVHANIAQHPPLGHWAPWGSLAVGCSGSGQQHPRAASASGQAAPIPTHGPRPSLASAQPRSPRPPELAALSPPPQPDPQHPMVAQGLSHACLVLGCGEGSGTAAPAAGKALAPCSCDGWNQVLPLAALTSSPAGWPCPTGAVAVGPMGMRCTRPGRGEGWGGASHPSLLCGLGDPQPRGAPREQPWPLRDTSPQRNRELPALCLDPWSCSGY